MENGVKREIIYSDLMGALSAKLYFLFIYSVKFIMVYFTAQRIKREYHIF